MGILDWTMKDTGYAVVAIKTTGLTHGYDRICEISVALAVPGQPIRLVLDTLVNPERPIAGGELHGIKQHQVTINAPVFKEVALDLLRALQGRVLVGHNLRFTLRFLTAEFDELGLKLETPYIDTMNLTAVLASQPPRPLVEACEAFDIEARLDPTSAAAALDTALLLRALLAKLNDMGLQTFGRLQGKKRHAFQRSFEIDPLPKGYTYDLPESVARISRHERGVEGVPNIALAVYWDALLVALDDLEITDQEQAHLAKLREDLELGADDVAMLHARAFSGSLVAMIHTGVCSAEDQRHLASLHACLTRLGWAPGNAPLASAIPAATKPGAPTA